MTTTKHFFLLETSTKFLLEQKESILIHRIWERYHLFFMDFKNDVLWLDGIKDEKLIQRIRKNIDVLDKSITDQMFFDLIDFKIRQDSTYRGFFFRSYVEPVSFLEEFDRFLLSHQQPAMHMFLMTADKQEELDYLWQQEQIENINSLGNDNLTTEEFIEKVYTQQQKAVAPFQNYYQQQKRYHEINISGKTEEVIFAEMCAIIDNI